MTVFHKVDEVLVHIIRPVVIVIGLGVSLLLVVGIVSRAFLGEPVFGLEEIMLLSIMWFYMLGATLASRENSHLKADFLDVITENPAAHRVAAIAATVISICASLAFCYWAADFILFSLSRGQTTPVFGIPFWVSQLSILVAAILLTAYLIRNLVIELRGPDRDVASNEAEE
ncbi:TRAP transporter small permease [Paracoccus saliphilus]|uniref:TRAP transporter small permease protein n=1 Tax=Paracoccus saliphilus TaxID=405559 RepID=A0AA45W504_9RHOB|nr:TRAP transporter small permease [Paracoccus saliphilus]WCR02112.1 TRAP transporter small permease subunit [Paracoccus saliphilus]SIS90141.1 TRAP-type C4-dicarboxylate transport system, small permease component [Paracoccus saliphilus]